jgi:hypothetical protein
MSQALLPSHQRTVSQIVYSRVTPPYLRIAGQWTCNRLHMLCVRREEGVRGVSDGLERVFCTCCNVGVEFV